MTKNKKLFIQSLVVVTMTSVFCAAQAQNSGTISPATVLEAIDASSAKAESQLKGLEEEEKRLKAEADTANKRVADVTATKAQVQLAKDSGIAINIGTFKDKLINLTHGNCTISVESDIPGEFFITKKDRKIRVLIAPDNSPKHVTAKKVNLNNIDQIEYNQPGWSDQDITKTSPFSAVIRTIPTASGNGETLSYSYFHGSQVDTRWLGGFGQSELSKEYDFVCADSM